MLSLSRGGQAIWMSKEDADKIGVHDNDWIEAVNRNGVVVARAIVSHRMPEGTVYMHHAQDRLIDVPDRRDVEEARRHPQLAHPAADQADPPDRRLRAAVLRVQLPRPDRQPARRGHRHPPPLAGGAVLMRVHGPDGDGDEPRQVHRLPHLLGHLQAGMDQPQRRRVRVVQQRRDPARAGLPAPLRGPGEVAGRLDAEQARPARTQGRRPAAQAAHHLLQPDAARRSTTTTSRGPTTTTRSPTPRCRSTPRSPGRSR